MKNNDPEFWPGSQVDFSLKQQMDMNYQDGITNLQTQWYQADLDQRTYLGDPELWGLLYPAGINLRRKMFNFNLTHGAVQVASGYQRRNRKATIAVPVHNEMQKTADQLTKCLYYVHKRNSYQVYSDAFEQGALVQGFGLVNIFLDYGCDPVSPDIRMRYVDFKSVLIDPYFRNKDLSDCRYIWTRQYFSKEEAKKLYPEHAEMIENIPYGQSPQDSKFYYMPENIGLNTKKILAFDEYWYLSTREAVYIVDSITEEAREFEGDEEDLRVAIMGMDELIKIVKKPKPTVRRAIRINGKVMIDEESPYGLDRYPFVGWYGNFNPDTIYYGYKFKGIVRDMRDAQYLYNRRKIADLDIIESQQQGIKMKKGALLTPDDALNTGHGRVLVINSENEMSDVEPMQIIPPSPVLLQMEDMLKNVMREISGINEEMLGSAVDDKAGILSMLRQGAGLTTLQKLYDQADESQSLCGDIIIDLIQKQWTYGKVKLVIGEDPTPEFDNKAFFKYGAKVIQGHLTETQQQQELLQIFELQQRFGNIFPMDEVVDVMTIQNKDRIIEKMAKNQQQQEQQQQQMFQLQMQQMQVDNETKLSYAQSQQGLAAERVAKIQTDKAVAVDKLQRAQKEDTSALLNLIKTLSELQKMDIDQIQSQVNLLKSLEGDLQENGMLNNTQEGVQNVQKEAQYVG